MLDLEIEQWKRQSLYTHSNYAEIVENYKTTTKMYKNFILSHSGTTNKGNEVE